MDVYIITGTTNGIGLELTKQLLAEGKTVYGIARKDHSMVHDNYHHVVLDLAETSKLANALRDIISEKKEDAKAFTLINNAGTVEPIGMAREIDGELVAKGIAVNLTAPMLLTNAFIKELAELDVLKKVVQISSGAGRNAYEGWSSYCAGKAGLDRFTEAVQLEEAKKPNGAHLVSIAPGIIDTNMQGKIRQSSDSEFPMVKRFKDYKESGQLRTPQEVAEDLIRFVESDKFYKVGVLTDLRKL